MEHDSRAQSLRDLGFDVGRASLGKTLLSAEVVRLGLAHVGGERWIRGAYRGEGGKESEKNDRSSHLLAV